MVQTDLASLLGKSLTYRKQWYLNVVALGNAAYELDIKILNMMILFLTTQVSCTRWQASRSDSSPFSLFLPQHPLLLQHVRLCGFEGPTAFLFLYVFSFMF
jgi:hypothetical protein